MDITPLYSRILLGSAPATGPTAAQHGIDVIVLCARGYQPHQADFPGIKLVLHAPMDDDDNVANFDIAMAAASRVVQEWSKGRTILITCQMGFNRSALVAALAIFFISGIPMCNLIDHIRYYRRASTGVPALSNRAFVRFLESIGNTRNEIVA